ncbi:MAG: D-glycerate dehydrogenase [Bdellovibrionaceae bacterium]|nr:D-glycerate dehydrogenase [Pseudobdellovibrionaceae bacterium]|tara:strand:+ start:63 stop:977 length:915 start_codon:yes stop_codon:yes gene_type:complete
MYKIVFTDPIYPDRAKKIFKKQGILFFPKNKKQLLKETKEADALITLLSYSLDKTRINEMPHLHVVGNYAVGLNNIDLSFCKKRKIKVIHTPKVLTRATAELALTLLMSLARRVPEGIELCKKGEFTGWKPDLLLGKELKGKTAVLFGKGRIGKETAKLFKAVGLKIEWIDRSSSVSEIKTTLKKADVLSIHTPLTPETKHWLNASKFNLLKKEVMIINTARGPLIDEKALISFLKNNPYAGAGLDVYEFEPAIPKELSKLKNTVLLPHIGSATHETREAMADCLFEGVLKALQGKSPWNQWKG